MKEFRERITVEVDRSGTLMRVSPPEAIGKVQAVLNAAGMNVTRLDSADAAAALERAESWYAYMTAQRLSREAYRVLSRRWTAEAKARAGLSDDQAGKLVSTLDRAFQRSVDEIPAGRYGEAASWRYAEAGAIGQVLDDAGGYLTVDQVSILRTILVGWISE